MSPHSVKSILIYRLIEYQDRKRGFRDDVRSEKGCGMPFHVCIVCLMLQFMEYVQRRYLVLRNFTIICHYSRKKEVEFRQQSRHVIDC